MKLSPHVVGIEMLNVKLALKAHSVFESMVIFVVITHLVVLCLFHYGGLIHDILC